MKYVVMLTAAWALAAGAGAPPTEAPPAEALPTEAVMSDVPPAEASPACGLYALAAVYPVVAGGPSRPNTLVWPDGTEMVYDDGVEKADFAALIEHACLMDQMRLCYPKGWPAAVPGKNHDPGRIRYEPFFRKLYGNSAAEVEGRLVLVPWLPAGPNAALRFTEVNGAAEALRRVGIAISRLPVRVRGYVAKPLGSFNWRRIAGQDTLSMHSFGIAVDFELPEPLHRYWRWESTGDEAECAYPEEVLEDPNLGAIVLAFEAQGFIWGGKWRHYDTMHFEYRPELLHEAMSPVDWERP